MDISILQVCLISFYFVLCNSAIPLASMGTWATLSRPLVCGLVVGIILGDPVQGTIIGATINIMFLGIISAGGAIPSDSISAGILGTAFALIGGLDINAAMALSIPLGLFGSLLNVMTMTTQCFFVAMFDKQVEKGNIHRLSLINVWLPYAIKSSIRFIICALILFVGSAAIDMITAALDGPIMDALSVMGGLIPAVGIGLMLLAIFKGQARWFFFIGFLASTYLGLNTISIALIFIILGILVVGFNSEDFSAFTTIEDTNETAYRLITKKDLIKSWIHWEYFNESCYNYERMQGLGFCDAMAPILSKIYKDDQEALIDALRRHSMFFNTDHNFGGMILGVCVAMEEQKKLGSDIPTEAFVSLKSSLMGPCAGIGDTLSQVVIIPVLSIIFINIALQGATWAPIAYTVIFMLIFYGYGYWMLFVGYKSGGEAILKLMECGLFNKVIEVAQIVGCGVSGAMVCNFVTFNWTVSMIQNEVVVFDLQSGVLDAILPGISPLVLVMSVYLAARKGVKTSTITFGVMILGFILGLLGWIG